MTDERLENLMGNLLRAGVALAALVMLAGGIWYVASQGSAPVDYHHFHAQPRTVRLLAGVSGPHAVMLLGLLILIATPVARVAFSLAAFAVQRDRVYVVLTAIVLCVLLYSIGTAWW